ncbi:adenylate/guanylate cyclase domain-containing protein [Devosia neptuniae]|uniref:Adenylate/guanylate cyclase domain-containing protein n=1 Tax=Devosia neptuniae TaxID=191302 RepID=A0ABY6CEW7_9HYPH|nr:adenylate/guanylate cyclase domain-containing protein [Devosia neptuniae]UXN69756.1 adenylate/guanylate cyclase domain-containing protein [Devosia neptuniae]
MWKRRLSALVFGAVIVGLLVALRASDPYPVQVARETAFDTFQQLRPRPAPADLPVRIIDIDETSLAKVGQWPWSRRTMATIANRLTELGAAAIAFDVLFPEPDRLSPSSILSIGADYDAEFATALATGPSILSLTRSEKSQAALPAPKSGFALTGTDPLNALPALGGAASPLPLLEQAAKGLGVASLDTTGAGVARRLPLLWSNGTAPLPTLSVEALRVAQGASTLVVLGDSAGMVEGLRVGDYTVPTGPTGDMWLYYRHLEPSIYVPAADLLAQNYATLAPLVAGHIVFIGASASGLLDIRASTLGEAVAGVSIHVQALEQILTGTFLNRADWVAGLEIVVLAVSGLAIVLVLLSSGPLVGLLFSSMIAALSLAGSWFAFSQYGLLIDPSFALFGAVLTYAAMAFFQFAVTDADKRRVRQAFAHYVEPTLLDRLDKDASLLKLGGDLREMSVMFSDVRNFSALSERTAPTELVAILNRLFAALGAAIIGQHGTIDKFMGDAVMAFWNAPATLDRHPLHACRAALSMRAALQRLNAGSAEPIAIGVGVATGPALVGNMGLESRFNYSCVGDTVNVASRLEGACRIANYDILISAPTRAAAPELACLPAGALELRGMSEREPVYLLLGDETLAKNPAFIALAAVHANLLETLAKQGPVQAEIERCATLGAALDARLVDFYVACLSRPNDFLASDKK